MHDFNLGIASDGLFWTAPFPADAVRVNPGAGRASMEASKLAVTDDFTLANALLRNGPTPVPATVSFAVTWAGVSGRFAATNTADGNRYTGRYVDVASASINWSANERGFSFTSTPGSSSTRFAEIGHERSGAFFS